MLESKAWLCSNKTLREQTRGVARAPQLRSPAYSDEGRGYRKQDRSPEVGPPGLALPVPGLLQDGAAPRVCPPSFPCGFQGSQVAPGLQTSAVQEEGERCSLQILPLYKTKYIFLICLLTLEGTLFLCTSTYISLARTCLGLLPITRA